MTNVDLPGEVRAVCEAIDRDPALRHAFETLGLHFDMSETSGVLEELEEEGLVPAGFLPVFSDKDDEEFGGIVAGGREDSVILVDTADREVEERGGFLDFVRVQMRSTLTRLRATPQEATVARPRKTPSP